MNTIPSGTNNPSGPPVPTPPNIAALYAPISKAAQTSGKQPTFINGVFPDATWDQWNDFGHDNLGIYLPYNTGGDVDFEHPEYITANLKVQTTYASLIAPIAAKVSQLAGIIPVVPVPNPGLGQNPAETNLLNQILAKVTAIAKKVGA